MGDLLTHLITMTHTSLRRHSSHQGFAEYTGEGSTRFLEMLYNALLLRMMVGDANIEGLILVGMMVLQRVRGQVAMFNPLIRGGHYYSY